MRVAVLALSLLSITAGTACADYLKGDPRECSYHRASTCAQLAAKYTAKAYLTQNAKQAGYVTCERVNGSLLRWDCSNIIGGTTTVVRVWFRATGSGWHRLVTIRSS